MGALQRITILDWWLQEIIVKCKQLVNNINNNIAVILVNCRTIINLLKKRKRTREVTLNKECKVNNYLWLNRSYFRTNKCYWCKSNNNSNSNLHNPTYNWLNNNNKHSNSTFNKLHSRSCRTSKLLKMGKFQTLKLSQRCWVKTILTITLIWLTKKQSQKVLTKAKSNKTWFLDLINTLSLRIWITIHSSKQIYQ